METTKKEWDRPSDPCPKCGSTKTVVRDYKVEMIEMKTIGPNRNRVPHNPHFTMSCEDCGHYELKSGCPGSHTP